MGKKKPGTSKVKSRRREPKVAAGITKNLDREDARWGVQRGEMGAGEKMR